MLILEVVTPYKSIITVNCKSVIVPGENGEFQVLKNHVSLLSLIRIGILSFIPFSVQDVSNDFCSKRKNSFNFIVIDGFTEINNNIIKVLIEHVILPKDVDKIIEEELISNLEKKIKNCNTHSYSNLYNMNFKLEQSKLKLELI
jgi:F-type H+-transporting ATPase subunit epsilon